MFQAPPSSDACDVICLSHLRWKFVFQRPQHLLTRCAREHRVFFIEEPITVRALKEPALRVDYSGPVTVVVPELPEAFTDHQRSLAQRQLLDEFLEREQILDF